MDEANHTQAQTDQQPLLPGFEEYKPKKKRGRRRTRFLEGERAGRWKILSYAGYDPKSEDSLYLCRCDCGTERVLRQRTLRLDSNPSRGSSSSCGCLRLELLQSKGLGRAKHGHARSQKAWSKEYRSWVSIKQRVKRDTYCLQRGIKLHPEWAASFEAFLAGVGSCPTQQHSLDRIDNAKGYEPGNVRWATWKEQSRNKRSNRFLTYQGLTLCYADWAERLGICRDTITNRIKRGLPIEEVLKPAR